MKSILAFAGSNSSTSINRQLVVYTTSLLNDVDVEVLDLNDYEMPIFSIDREVKGFPQEVLELTDKIKETDGLVISLAEYNGAYTSAFKNIMDWLSRVEQKMFMDKPMLLMAASPGGRGGQSVLQMAQDRFPRHSANIIETFSLPDFYKNFSDGKITEPALNEELKLKTINFNKAL